MRCRMGSRDRGYRAGLRRREDESCGARPRAGAACVLRAYIANGELADGWLEALSDTAFSIQHRAQASYQYRPKPVSYRADIRTPWRGLPFAESCV
jgi:hypothetical protein